MNVSETKTDEYDRSLHNLEKKSYNSLVKYYINYSFQKGAMMNCSQYDQEHEQRNYVFMLT